MPPAARVGDMHVCPMITVLVPHVGGPILPPGYPKVLIGGLPAARMGDLATCVGPPDVIIMGCPNVLIGGQPAARMGDPGAAVVQAHAQAPGRGRGAVERHRVLDQSRRAASVLNLNHRLAGGRHQRGGKSQCGAICSSFLPGVF